MTFPKPLLILLVASVCLFVQIPIGSAQEGGPEEVSPDQVTAYRQLPTSGSIDDRLAAFEAFIDQYPGTQLSLRAMRDVSVFFLLRDTPGENGQLVRGVEWLGARLRSAPYEWVRYDSSSDSVLLDRIETQLLYSRMLSGVGRYDDALRALSEVQVAGEARADIWRNRPDLKEQLDFSRCWCLHGKARTGEDFRAPAVNYEHFIEDYPTSDFLPAALRNAGVCISKLDPVGGRERAAKFLSRLKQEYPKSAEAADPEVNKILGLP